MNGPVVRCLFMDRNLGVWMETSDEAYMSVMDDIEKLEAEGASLTHLEGLVVAAVVDIGEVRPCHPPDWSDNTLDA